MGGIEEKMADLLFICLFICLYICLLVCFVSQEDMWAYSGLVESSIRKFCETVPYEVRAVPYVK